MILEREGGDTAGRGVGSRFSTGSGHCPSVTSVLGETPGKTQSPPVSGLRTNPGVARICLRPRSAQGAWCAWLLPSFPRPCPRLLRERAPSVCHSPPRPPLSPTSRERAGTWGAVGGAGSAGLPASAPHREKVALLPRGPVATPGTCARLLPGAGTRLSLRAQEETPPGNCDTLRLRMPPAPPGWGWGGVGLLSPGHQAAPCRKGGWERQPGAARAQGVALADASPSGVLDTWELAGQSWAILHCPCACGTESGSEGAVPGVRVKRHPNVTLGTGSSGSVG